jgi:hypothetical protein
MSEDALDWFWGLVQGDFKEDPSAAQIIIGTAIGCIPIVGQIMDVRDICANLQKIKKDPQDVLLWVGLVVTLIGLVPGAGDLVKGVFRFILKFLRNGGADAVIAVRSVLGFLRGRGYGDPVKYLKSMPWQKYTIECKSIFQKFMFGILDGIELVRANWLSRTLFRNYEHQLSMVQAEIRLLQQLGEVKIPEAMKHLKKGVDDLLKRVEKEEVAGSSNSTVRLAHSSKPLLRQEYELAVKRIDADAHKMRKAGKSETEIAEMATQRRRAIGLDFKGRTDPDLRQLIYGRNMEKYGDELGPLYQRNPDGSGWSYKKRNSKTRQFESFPVDDATAIKNATQAGGDDFPWDKVLEYSEAIKEKNWERKKQLLDVIERLMGLSGRLAQAKRSGDEKLIKAIELEIAKVGKM